MQGTKPHIKSGLFVKKLVNKFEKVSGNIISSYSHEMDMIENLPKSPDRFQEALIDQLNLKDADELAKFVIHKMDREQSTKGY